MLGSVPAAASAPESSVADSPAYHDMETISDKQFKQDSTSYFRACYLMEKLGLPTDLYREHLVRIVPRVNEHLESRGANQKMAFEWYYAHFGFDFPAEYAQAESGGIIASRRDPTTFDRLITYHFTHEILVPNDFGEAIRIALIGHQAAECAGLLSGLEVCHRQARDLARRLGQAEFNLC